MDSSWSGCHRCGDASRRLHLCSACETAAYCGRKCQRAGWSAHKAECSRGQEHLRLAREAMANHSPSRPLDGEDFVDGVEIVDTRSALGRVLLATRSFCTGQVVLAEAPLVVFSTRNSYALLAAYVHADEATRAAILELYHPPLASPDAQDAIAMAAVLCTRGRVWCGVMSTELAARLILIRNVNAHAFRMRGDPCENADRITTASDPEPSGVELDALFTVASKAQHACKPNVRFISSGGRLEYVALQDIPAGAAIAISYISTFPETIRSERQAQLRQSKFFDCTCDLCQGPDYCRPLTCPRCDGRSAICTGTTWRCHSCGACLREADLAAAMDAEAALKTQFLNAKYLLTMEAVTPQTVHMAQAARRAIVTSLSPLHHLQVKSLDMVACVEASFAHMIATPNERTRSMFLQGGRVWDLKACYKRAAVAMRWLVQCREHAHAVCEGRLAFGEACRLLEAPRWDKAAPPLLCNTSDAFYAGMEFWKAGCHGDAAEVFRRHFDAILTMLSPEDPDAALVRSIVEKD